MTEEVVVDLFVVVAYFNPKRKDGSRRCPILKTWSPVCQPEFIQSMYEIDYFSGPWNRNTGYAQTSYRVAAAGS